MIYDISMKINEDVQVYKNDPAKKPIIEAVSDFEKADFYESTINMNLHTGTHVDYPLHMIEAGDDSDTEKLERLITEVLLVDATDVKDSIGTETVKQLDLKENDFVLFKTRNSFSDEFLNDFVYLNEEAAKYLVEQGIAGVGTDGLGIERAQAGHPTHKLLLGNDIIIIEGLRLKNVGQGRYKMMCLPLKLSGVEATPARIVLEDL